jgi:hypothetical protein
MGLLDIENQVMEWHRKTFPNATFDAIAMKFEEEYEEFCNAIDFTDSFFQPETREEFADMCIVYMAGLNKLGLPSLSQLISDKLEINKKRKLGKETKNGDRPRKKQTKKQ